MVLAEHTGLQVSEGTYELIGKARELASALGGVTEVALLGPRDLAGQLAGADVVVSVDHPALEEYLPEAYERTLLEVLAQRSPRLLLMSNVTIGLDLGSALSARWEAPLVAYASALAIEDGAVIATAKLLGGKVLADVELSGERGIVTVLGGAFSEHGRPARAQPGGRPSRTPGRARLTADVTSPGRRGRDRRRRHQRGRHVVSVGRGIESQDNIEIVLGLAEALGVPLSASRPVVDAGWLPKTRQVGQSGLKVKPRAYLAFGISGAPEHLEGMRNAELIIACNTDPRRADLRRRPLRHDRRPVRSRPGARGQDPELTMTGPLSLVATHVTRPVFEGVGPLGRAAFYAVAAVSTVVFCWGVWLRVRKYRMGRAAGRGPAMKAALGARLRNIGSGASVAKANRATGVAHFFILWGFVAAFIATGHPHDRHRRRPQSLRLIVGHQDSFFHGTFFIIFTFVVDTMGFAFLVSLIYMAVRRGVRRPWRLGYERAGMPAGGYSRRRLVEGDWLFLGLLITILVTAYLLTGLRILGQGMAWFTVFSPFGRAVAEVLSGLGMTPAQAVEVHTVVWWVHAASCRALSHTSRTPRPCTCWSTW